MKRIYHILAAAGAVAALATCSGAPHWTLRGEIPSASDADLRIESLTFNGWMPVDTVHADASGRFTAQGAPKGYPDIYRLVAPDGETVYFPVDSIETVTLSGDGRTGWRIVGSTSAAIMTAADSLISSSLAANGVDATLGDSLLKRNLTSIILSDPASVGAYYIVSRRIGGKPLFDPAVRHDLRMIGAVANAWISQHPGSQRTRELSDTYMAGRRATSTSLAVDTLHAQTIGHFEIELYDNQGQLRTLGDAVEGNRLTLLNFTAYAADESPAFNILLNDLYSRYGAQGLGIYQVSVDTDEVLWRRAAEALPWTTVYNPPATGAQTLLRYMVTSLPTSFLIDSQGEIVERIDDITRLPEAVRRHI